jgi:plasmid stabilization system protein ParE
VALVRWCDEAADEFIAVPEFLGSQNERAAERFATQVRDAVQQLTMFPNSGQVYEPFHSNVVREIPIGRFRLVYLVFSPEEIDVISLRPLPL